MLLPKQGFCYVILHFELFYNINFEIFAFYAFLLSMFGT